MAERVLLLVVEAMEIALVRQGVHEGWLPAIAGLLEEGAGVRLVHGPDLLPGAGWTTVFTGRPVQEHLLVFNQQLVPGTTRIERVPPERARAPVFWEMVSEAGRPSTVVSPHAGPRIDPFHGTLVQWGTGEPYSSASGRPWCNRPAVLDDLQRRWPERRYGFLPGLPRSPSSYRDYLDGVCRQIRMQGEAMAHLMETTPWDLFFGTIYETHEAGHLLWQFQDPVTAASVADDGLRQPMRRIYQEADAAIGRLLERRDGDTRVFLFTSSGMTHMVPTYLATRSFLLQGGWMRLSERAPAGPDRWLWLANRARSVAHGVMPLALRRAMSRVAPHAHRALTIAEPLLGLDWSATSAFPLPNDTHSAIRFNLAGREPGGVVEPGSGYERLAADIDAAASALVDTRTGAPVAKQVYRMDQVFGGSVGDVLPDIGIEWEPFVAESLESPRTGRITVPSDPRTGDHRPEGFLLGAGPGISHRPGALDGASSETSFGLLDLAPTVLAALGLPVPASLPGRVIGAVLPA